MECEHRILVRIGPDIYACQSCGIVFDIVLVRQITDDYLSAMITLALRNVPDVEQKLEAAEEQQQQEDE